MDSLTKPLKVGLLVILLTVITIVIPRDYSGKPLSVDPIETIIG